MAERQPMQKVSTTFDDTSIELDLYKKYLAALGTATTLLLENSGEQNWTEILRLLAETAQISNCGLFLNENDESGRLVAKLRSTWSSGDALSRLDDFSPLRTFCYDDYQLLSDTLHVGMVLSRNLTDLPPQEYSLLSRQDVTSILCIPLLIAGEFAGFIGFFCQREKPTWHPLEINALCGIANGLALSLAGHQAEISRRASEKRLRALVGATEDIVIEYDANGRILHLWADHRTHSFIPNFDIVGCQLDAALPADMAHAMIFATPKVFANGERETIEFTLPVGTDDRYFLGRLQPITSETGNTRNMVALIRDVTENIQEEARRQTMLETLNMLEETIMGLSLDGRLQNLSAAWSKLIGDANLPVSAHYGQPLVNFVYIEDIRLVESAILSLAAGNKNTGPVRFRLEQGNGEPIWVEAKLTPTYSPHGQITGLCGVLRDITSSYLQERRITQLALHDGLTGLPNRILLEDHLAQAIARAQRNGTKVALGFIDLDHFKHINDTLGHKAGDTVLTTLSQRLQSVLREMDTLSRWGGDEFVVLLPDATSEESARSIAERLRDVARLSIDIDGIETKLTISIGFAVFPDDADSAETLMSVADHTMFHAKNVGRNNVQFFCDIHDKNLDRENVMLQTRLSRAIQDRLLQVFYQPIVNTDNGQIVAFEALARWHDDQNGWIAPDIFIPMAEHLGIIHELGNQVFEHALNRLKGWREKGYNLRMSVNLSRTQLFAANFVADLCNKLASYCLAPQDIILEITESVALLDISYESKRLHELSVAGFSIAIDDFGTGNSALSHLHQMSVNCLKIDSSFTARLGTEDGRRIVQAIIQVADALKLEKIMEGVETLEAANYLKALGVTQMQGHLFCDAVPAGMCEMLLQQPLSNPDHKDIFAPIAA
jgi:diguanylate cyclase (GGDEF)-like protein/PAS domain S-box-containing protein